MADTRRSILEQVASGSLSPDDAARRLGDLTGDEASGEPDRSHGDPDPVSEDGPVATVKVLGSFRTTAIVGDPSVRTAVAEGPHTAKRDGDTLVIGAEDDIGGDTNAFRFERGRNRSRIVLGFGSKPMPLKVRMHPSLALEVAMAAGALKITDVAGPISAQVSAGAIKIEGFQGPLDLHVAGGGVSATGRLAHGHSKIECVAGSVRVRLQEGSDVTITARAGLGKVVLPGTDRAAFVSGQQEAVIGRGRATLDIDASMGAVVVDTA